MESRPEEDEVDYEDDGAPSDSAAPLVGSPSEPAASSEAASARPEASQSATNLPGTAPREGDIEADEDADFDVSGLVDALLGEMDAVQRLALTVMVHDDCRRLAPGTGFRWDRGKFLETISSPRHVCFVFSRGSKSQVLSTSFWQGLHFSRCRGLNPDIGWVWCHLGGAQRTVFSRIWTFLHLKSQIFARPQGNL